MTTYVPLFFDGRSIVLRKSAALEGKFASNRETTGGSGTEADPWDLTTALTKGSVSPGETLYLRGGTYVWPNRADQQYGFVLSLQGTADSRITVRPYPGERAILDGGLVDNGVAGAYAQYVTVRDLDIMVSENQSYSRVSSDTETTGLTPNRPIGGLNIFRGTSIYLINNHIYDNTTNGLCLWGLSAGGCMAYGNICYNNGYVGTDRPHGHGTYCQNGNGHTDWQYHWNNIYYDNYSLSVQIYGSSAAWVRYIDFRDNIAYWGDTQEEPKVLIGGNDPGDDSQNNHYEVHNLFTNCMFQMPYSASGWTDSTRLNKLRLGYACSIDGVNQKVANYNWTDIWKCANFGTMQWSYLDSYVGTTQVTPEPSWSYVGTPTDGPWFTLNPNTYDSNRAHIAAQYFGSEETLNFPITGFLSAGDSWELLDPSDFYGTPLASGTVSGTTISIPTTTAKYRFLCGVLMKV